MNNYGKEKQMPKKKSTDNEYTQPPVGYKHDEGAGEWSFTCASCNQTIYAPTKSEIQNQFIKHSLVKPIENRKCPNKW